MKTPKTSPASWMSVLVPNMPEPSSKKSGTKESKSTPVRATSPRLRKRVVEAIKALEASIFYFQLDRDWLSLLNEYREVQASGVTNPHYQIRMNQRYPGLVEHIAELAKARYELDNYDPKDDFTSGSISLSASYAKKDRVSDERANVKQALIDKKYLIAPRGNKKIVGSKGWIKHSVLSVLSTHVGDRTFDAIVHELKSESGIVEK